MLLFSLIINFVEIYLKAHSLGIKKYNLILIKYDNFDWFITDN